MPPFQTVRLCETLQAGAFATAAMAESQAIPSPLLRGSVGSCSGKGRGMVARAGSTVPTSFRLAPLSID